MKVRAASVGSIAWNALNRSAGRAIVRYALSNAVILEITGQMVVVTHIDSRSPYTINLPGHDHDLRGLRNLVNQPCECRMTSKGCIVHLGKLIFSVEPDHLYKSPLPSFIPDEEFSFEIRRALLDTSFAIRQLFDVVNSDKSIPNLPESIGLERFTSSVLVPILQGDLASLSDEKCYLELLGVGRGFTPAGDDFLTGFLYAMNFLRRWHKMPRITLGLDFLSEWTSWVGAMLISYAESGHIDEASSSLLSSIAQGNRFASVERVLDMASRGHTSGIDTALGIITGCSFSLEVKNPCGGLERVLAIVRGRDAIAPFESLR